MNERPVIHCLVYGDPGAKKSTFAATFPKPMLVCFFDPQGKDGPYLRQGTPTDLYETDDGVLSRDVLDPAGDLLIRLCYFGDMDPKHPTGYKQFLRYMQNFYAEVRAWATVVLDSVTFMELGARMHEKYVLNPKTKEPRQWWAGATDNIEEMLQGSFGAMPINVCVIAHIDEHKDEFNGQILRRPKAPGRLSKGLAAGYSEVYHAYATLDDKGERMYVLQTASDNMWIAESQINAPDPSWPDYEALWPEA